MFFLLRRTRLLETGTCPDGEKTTVADHNRGFHPIPWQMAWYRVADATLLQSKDPHFSFREHIFYIYFKIYFICELGSLQVGFPHG